MSATEIANTNRQWVLKQRPRDKVSAELFEQKSVDIPELRDGEFLVRVTHLSFDPTQRGWMSHDTYIPAIPVGGVVRAFGIGQVVKSRHSAFSPGQWVQGGFGWQEYCVTNGETDLGEVSVLPEGVTPELALGVMGLTGMTAWFGLREVGQPRAGDTVFVTGAAGATGSVVVQIAKDMGCKVIGIAGGADKCAWVRDVAGADACIDYKSDNVMAELKRHAPNGLDVIFENVGGEILEAGLANIAERGRIVLCGTISQYEIDPREQKGIRFLSLLTIRRARMEGFIVLDYIDRYPEAIAGLKDMMSRGKLQTLEDVRQGFENIPDTLARLFTGKNFGKQLLKLADPPLE
tara:strand:- start:15538 stop:16581 length:1044 start_codon:yes stop_codon:yes gene_type:complete